MHLYLAGHVAALRVDVRRSGDSEGALLDEYTPIRQKTRRGSRPGPVRDGSPKQLAASVGSELKAVFANLTERGVGNHGDFRSDRPRSRALHDRGHDRECRIGVYTLRARILSVLDESSERKLVQGGKRSIMMPARHR